LKKRGLTIAGYGVTIFYKVIDGGLKITMKHYWSEIDNYKYGDDSLGMLAFFGGEPTPKNMADCFSTHAGAWGNIFKGEGAGGIYGEIITGIKKYGFERYLFMYQNDNYRRGVLKNKPERHLRIGRRVIKRKEIERIRRPYTEPLF